MNDRIVGALLVCLSLLGAPYHAKAVVLSFTPATQDIGVGGAATVEVVISDLGVFAPPSLGAFIVEVVYDDAILDLADVTYGALLGSTDPLDFETDIITTPSAGSVRLDVFSFLLDVELDALQPDAFTLASLRFRGDTPGTSALVFGFVDLSDAAFPATSLIATLETGAITVVAAVPEPGTVAALLLGLLVLLPARCRCARMLPTASPGVRRRCQSAGAGPRPVGRDV